jgi:hypothetical protein
MAAVAVATVTGPGKVWTEPASRPGVDEYPVRIAKPLFMDSLETDSGPVAGQLVTHADGEDRYAITENGGLLSIPYGDTTGDFLPALSPDGTKLGYLRDASTFVLQDLSAGRLVEFDEIGDNRSDSTLPYMTQGQAPGFWSPSTQQLLIMGWRPDAGSISHLAVGLDGTVTEVPSPRRPASGRRAGHTAGWVDDKHVGWVQDVRRDGSSVVDFVVTDLAGTEVTRTPLAVRIDEARVSQWSGTLSDDATRLLLLTDDPEQLWLVDTETGQVLDEGNSSSHMSRCSPSWRGDEPIIPAYLTNDEGGGQLTTLAGERVAVVDPALNVSCIAMASQGLTGSPAGGPARLLFGTSDAWITWHYIELLAGALVVLVGAAVARWTWRRRRQLPSASP